MQLWQHEIAINFTSLAGSKLWGLGRQIESKSGAL
jgi:hypothetical protein